MPIDESSLSVSDAISESAATAYEDTVGHDVSDIEENICNISINERINAAEFAKNCSGRGIAMLHPGHDLCC